MSFLKKLLIAYHLRIGINESSGYGRRGGQSLETYKKQLFVILYHADAFLLRYLPRDFSSLTLTHFRPGCKYDSRIFPRRGALYNVLQKNNCSLKKFAGLFRDMQGSFVLFCLHFFRREERRFSYGISFPSTSFWGILAACEGESFVLFY